MARVDTGKPWWTGRRAWSRAQDDAGGDLWSMKSRQQLGTQERSESSGIFSCSWKHRGDDNNDSYMKAEITFLDFLHHRSGKLSFLLFVCFVSFCFLNHPHPWQYYLCGQYQCEATVRKSEFRDNGSAVSLTWRSAFQHALKCGPPGSPEELWGWWQKDSATHGIDLLL